jgi:hypothetical protein
MHVKFWGLEYDNIYLAIISVDAYQLFCTVPVMFQSLGFMSKNFDRMQVLVRTRPVGSSEAAVPGFVRCVRQDGPHTITWLGQPETRFTFDHVAGESITQVHN